MYTHEQWKRNTQMYNNILRMHWIYFHRGFLVILWIQKTDTILSLSVLMWNVRLFIRMRTFQPLFNRHFQNQHLQAWPGYNNKGNELLVMWYEFSGILNSIFLLELFKADVITSWLVTSLTMLQGWYFFCMHHFAIKFYINAKYRRNVVMVHTQDR